ncbi:hypothetical protein C5167_046037 [Papaver somniferum]|uniref:Uncharacterized protein n=1 Tax=Papaver somniferum TaxID=3469 RepID=A0A4Y7LG41_PAPSO|nr:hypothetical protein C5167_046037 [Papaver somniferum]
MGFQSFEGFESWELCLKREIFLQEEENENFDSVIKTKKMRGKGGIYEINGFRKKTDSEDSDTGWREERKEKNCASGSTSRRRSRRRPPPHSFSCFAERVSKDGRIKMSVETSKKNKGKEEEFLRCHQCVGLTYKGVSQKMKMEAEERLKYCKYLLQALLPVLNQIHEEQAMEKELEANIQGAWLKLLSHYLHVLLSRKWALQLSVRDCNRAVVRLPSYTKAWYRRGMENASMGNYKDAIQDLDIAMNMELSSGGNSKIKEELEIIKKQSRRVKNSRKKASNMNCNSIETQIMDEINEQIENMKQDELESELEELEGAELEEQLLQPATMVIMLCGGRSFEGFPSVFLRQLELLEGQEGLYP